MLGITEWLAAGLTRIVYLDIDAHHGDGVQDAFHDDARVFTLSVHEAGRWPRTGPAEDRAGGLARNFPVLPGLNDSELRWLHEAILPLVDAFRPQAIMLQAAPMRWRRTRWPSCRCPTTAYFQFAAEVMRLAPRLVVTGGGGYNPYSCWALLGWRLAAR